MHRLNTLNQRSVVDILPTTVGLRSNPSPLTLWINSGYPPEQLKFSSLQTNSALFGPTLLTSVPIINAYIHSLDLEDVSIFYFMTFIPKIDILATRGRKVSAILEDFLTEKKKKLCLVLVDVAKLFYSMTFIPKFHILATGVQKSRTWTIFVHISTILEDFLTKKKKKLKSCVF